MSSVVIAGVRILNVCVGTMSEEFDQAVYDSGYFLSNREEDIARWFWEAGVKSAKPLIVDLARAQAILEELKPTDEEDLENAWFVMDWGDELSPYSDDPEVKSIQLELQYHYDEYDSWDDICRRVLNKPERQNPE